MAGSKDPAVFVLAAVNADIDRNSADEYLPWLEVEVRSQPTS
jgi:hypothetical protein